MGEELNSESIINSFGLSFNPEFDCINNGIINGVKIIKSVGLEAPPRLFFLRKYWHVYPIWQKVVLNWGVTSKIGEYPNESFSFILRHGEDRTIEYLETTINSFSLSGPEKNTYNQNLAIVTAFPNADKEALSLIKSWHQKITFISPR